MADIKTTPLASGSDRATGESGENLAENEALIQAIELLFFAYRDFVSDPDAILEADGLGRAHILRITKQSLARVLRELIERELIEQKTGTRDRRQRHLHLTEAGTNLERRLAVPQHARVAKAIADAGPEAADAWKKILLNRVNEDERAAVETLITNGEVP